MYRRRMRWGPLAALAGLVLAAPPAASQQTEEELVRRLESLAPQVEAAAREADRVQRLREAAARKAAAATVDTFNVGPLTILTVPSQRELAEEMYREVWEAEYAGHVQASSSLEDHVFTFQWRPDPQPIYLEGPHRRVESPMYRRTRGTMEEMIRESIGSVLALDFRSVPRPGEDIADWHRGHIQRPDDGVGEQVYRQLASTPSYAARDCLAGDLDQCWTALGLGIEGEPLEQWYNPEERRALVSGMSWFRGRRLTSDNPDFNACVEGGSIRACDAYLRRWTFRQPRPPLQPTTARNALTWFALQAGGEGSWTRLLEDPGMTPEEALLHASGLSKEELMATWRDWVLEHEPTHRAGFGWGHLTTLFWILAFAAFAMRSTRWRLG